MKRWSHLLVLIPFLMIPTITPAQESATPTPESVIGWAPCADYKLATYEQIAEYFHVLDKATDRMQLVDIGETAEGRTQLMAIISSESNMQNLARYKEISQQLARARVSGDEAQALVDEGKAIVWIDFGLHSTEVAHGQTAPWMAYKAVTEETEEMQVIRDNVIFLLVPNMNPDGTTLVAEWYMQHVGTQYEGAHSQSFTRSMLAMTTTATGSCLTSPRARTLVGRCTTNGFLKLSTTSINLDHFHPASSFRHLLNR